MSSPASLDDRYTLEYGRVLLTGSQALVRLALMQRARDSASGLNTAGFVSGYRGSPLGGFDFQLEKERARLEAVGVRFQPGVNEDLAATAIWGTQQTGFVPGAKYDGVFAIWYGKGPGVDRSGDAIKHGNRMGTNRHGGVLVVFGDDHPGKSSTIAHQSEPALAACGVPVLYPATVQELLDLGLHGFALSRSAGVWVGLKTVNETAEATGTVEIDSNRVVIVEPVGSLDVAGGVHARVGYDPMGDDIRLQRYKLPRVHAYVRANGIDRITHGSRRRGLGIVAAGKSWLDVVHALALLGADEQTCEALGVSVYKPALIWPLEPTGISEFASSNAELLFVEEKTAFMEPQAAHVLFNMSAHQRPSLSGKLDPTGQPLFPSDVVLAPIDIALVIADRMQALGLANADVQARADELRQRCSSANSATPAPIARGPYFCSGCPHNTSTRLPDGSLAMAGIGCHTMALFMERQTLPPTHMGGEGLTWAGLAPFTDTHHMFQNLGDGTYYHSGSLAIRAAVNAGVNVTYKILANDAVAMTGGQLVEGGLSVAEITHQLRAERVQRIAVVSDDTDKYGSTPGFASGTTVHHRSELDAVQRQLREIPGVTALIYDQVCAAEKRRRRKRKRIPEPDARVVINPLVCEGCGDCSVQANCVSIEPVETPFGRKRRIDQSSCNKDYSCLAGFCPSFVTITGARLRKRTAQDFATMDLAGLPVPEPRLIDGSCAILLTGIGGAGIVTIGAVLGMAAHLDGFVVSAYDMTGLAQKGGAVLSHVKIARNVVNLGAARIGIGEADVILGCDPVVTASGEVVRAMSPGRTKLAVSTHLVPTGEVQGNPDFDFHGGELLARIARSGGPSSTEFVDAHRAAEQLLGDSIGTNMFLLGFALQKGWLPVSAASVDRAIDLNATAVIFNKTALALGRLSAHAPQRLAELLAAGGDMRNSSTSPDAEVMDAVANSTLEAQIAVREAFLTRYQDGRYAARYRALVERVAAAEREFAPGKCGLAEVAARGYFKLLAYKDEYEVARLHTDDSFREQIEREFEGRYRLTYHFAPPALARRDPADGRPIKRSFGPWITPVLRVLARLRFLRGTAFDPFGYTGERRLERQLISDYEKLVEELMVGLSSQRHELAVELAALPERIRGYGHVKERQSAAALGRQAELMKQWGGAMRQS